MPKLTEYPEAQSFDENDILIKDGTNGTKKIKIEKVLEYMVDPTLTTPGKAADAKATKDAIDAVGGEVADVKTQLTETDEVLSNDDNVPINFRIVEPGYSIRWQYGDTAVNSDYAHTDYIDISKYSKISYKRTGTTAASTSIGMAFYDSTKTYIPNSGIMSAKSQSAIGYVESLYTTIVPQNAVYARFSTYKDTAIYGVFEIYGYSKILGVFAELNAEIDAQNNKFNAESYVVARTLSIPTLWEFGKSINSIGTVESNTPTYALSYYVPVNSGDKIVYNGKTNDGTNSYACLIATYNSDKIFRSRQSLLAFDGTNISYTMPVNGYVRFMFGREASTALAITASDFEDFSCGSPVLDNLDKDYTDQFNSLHTTDASLQNQINGINARLDDVSDGKNPTEKLFIGTLENQDVYQDGLHINGATQYRCSMASTSALPYESMTVNIKSENNVDMKIIYGTKPNVMNSDSGWLTDGDTFTFPSSAYYYQITFAYDDESTHNTIAISANDVMNMLDSEDIQITYARRESYDIISGNSESEKYIKAIMIRTSQIRSENLGLGVLPVFAHISDLHSDTKRYENFVKYCNYLGAIDGCLISGDIVGETASNRLQYINDLSDSTSIPQIVGIGNHETIGTSNVGNIAVIPFASKNNYNVSSSGTYYYRDFPLKKIRVISLNVYENKEAIFNITQTQINWLIDRLLELTDDLAGYGVIIMMHAPEVEITQPESGLDKFYQTTRTYWQQITGSTVIGTPICDIIDAFIEKGTINTTFTSDGNTITIQADFSGVSATSEFICYVNGHEHEDFVGYLTGTEHMQLNLNVACGEAMYGPVDYPWAANENDVPRGYYGSVQDLFNIYVIDRADKKVRIARVGSNMSYQMRPRDYLIIPYAETI